jgi:hypothetical protein
MLGLVLIICSEMSIEDAGKEMIERVGFVHSPPRLHPPNAQSRQQEPAGCAAVPELLGQRAVWVTSTRIPRARQTASRRSPCSAGTTRV